MAVRGWPRTLKWRDFRTLQRAPTGVSEDAQVEPGIQPPANAQVVADGNQFKIGSFNLSLLLVADGTWIVRGRETASLLVHEQGHWDIAGLVGYENHRALEALRAPDSARLGELVASTQERLQQKLDALTAQYDEETEHSRNATQQTRWNQLIRSCIQNQYRALPDP